MRQRTIVIGALGILLGMVFALRADATYMPLAPQTESSATTTADTGSTAPGVTTLRFYAFFPLPSTEPFYRISGIEWKNKATVAGSTLSGVDLVDTPIPVAPAVLNVALGVETANAGANAVQRVSRVSSDLIPGGTIIGVWIQASNATHTYGTFTGVNFNSRKTVTYPTAANVPQEDSTAWTSSATQAYIKVYYVPYK